MTNILYIGLPIAGIVLGWTIRWLYARFQLSASEQRAERVKQDAIKEAEAQKKEIFLQFFSEKAVKKKKKKTSKKTLVCYNKIEEL